MGCGCLINLVVLCGALFVAHRISDAAGVPVIYLIVGLIAMCVFRKSAKV